MLSNNNIAVTIGDSGVVIAVHSKNIIVKKIFITELTNEIKDDLKNLIFYKYPKYPVSIIIDTVDQSFRKKVYPAIRTFDLLKIIKRDMASDGDKKSFKTYKILKKPKKTSLASNKYNRRECLLITVSASDKIDSWLRFLLDIENHLTGVYSLPIESSKLLTALKKNIKLQSKIKKKQDDLYLFITENKVSGLRQMVFSESQGVLFSRIINMKSTDSDFLEKFEKDILSTFEYLKRITPSIKIQDLDIINILSFETLEKIKNINNNDLQFVNYTPCKAASEIGYPKLLPKNARFSDILLSKVISKGSKIQKFTTNKIKFFDRFFIGIQATKVLNVLFAVASIVIFTNLVYNLKILDEKINTAETEMKQASSELIKIQSSSFSKEELEAEDLDFDRIFDFGKTEERLNGKIINIRDAYLQLKFLKKFNVKLSSFKYQNDNFKKTFDSNSKYKISFSGTLFNQSGEIEDLFIEFDTLTKEVKENFKKANIKYNELPRNIDFHKKHYEHQINFEVENR